MASLGENVTSFWTEQPGFLNDEIRDRYDRLPLFYKVLRVIGELVSVIIILIGNIVTIIAVFRYRNLKTITNNFVVSLSLADLLIIPSRTYFCSLMFTSDFIMWKMGLFFRNIPLMLSQGVSLYTLLLIAIDRYVAVNHAMSYRIIMTRKRSWVMIGTVWSYMTVAIVFLWTYFGLQADDAVFESKQLPAAIPPFVNQFLITPHILIALGLTILLYLRIFWAMKKQKARIGQQTAASDLKSRKVTQLMATVLVVLLVCWLPYAVMSSVMDPLDPDLPIYVEYIENFCYFLVYTSSCTNPFLYAMKSPEFRKAYQKMFHAFSSKKVANNSNLTRGTQNSAS